jgi:DNA-directed RNA polymerase subunit M/transcription elongation factor TFIIS
MHRHRECFRCGHKWVSEVRLSRNTANLSGEVTEWCPKCQSHDVMSLPAEPCHMDNQGYCHTCGALLIPDYDGMG